MNLYQAIKHVWHKGMIHITDGHDAIAAKQLKQAMEEYEKRITIYYFTFDLYS